MRIKAVIQRILMDMRRDKRTLGLMFLAPLFVLTLMYFIFGTNEEPKLKLGVTPNVSETLVHQFSNNQVEIKHLSSDDHLKHELTSYQLDGVLSQKENQYRILYANDNPTRTQALKQSLGQAIQKSNKAELEEKFKTIPMPSNKMTLSSPKIDESYVYGTEDQSYFDYMFPILMGFFVFFFVFLISGIALLRERQSGTLERLMATPIKRSELVLGYLLGFGIIAVIQTLLIVLFAVFLLHMHITGSLFWVIVINILVAFAALSMGLFISTFANSEFQMMQFIPLIIVPQVFFSGIIPLENMNPWLANIGYIFPLRYAGDALTKVIIKGQGIETFGGELLVLVLFIVLFTVLNILGLKKYRNV
ncbi:ABC transporter permease [Staphylococcus chromogenes]|uniref:ABC transporter permease n=1 Tax=Staphylococcus chromogenes TaxID=46126 RepID=UPI003D7B9D6A